jgi:hypothetical protein
VRDLLSLIYVPKRQRADEIAKHGSDMVRGVGVACNLQIEVCQLITTDGRWLLFSQQTSFLTENFLGKMAGLVDYGVDSDRESNDSPNHESSSVSIFIINIAIM